MNSFFSRKVFSLFTPIMEFVSCDIFRTIFNVIIDTSRVENGFLGARILFRFIKEAYDFYYSLGRDPGTSGMSRMILMIRARCNSFPVFAPFVKIGVRIELDALANTDAFPLDPWIYRTRATFYSYLMMRIMHWLYLLSRDWPKEFGRENLAFETLSARDRLESNLHFTKRAVAILKTYSFHERAALILLADWGRLQNYNYLLCQIKEAPELCISE